MADPQVERISEVEALEYSRRVQVQSDRLKLVNPTEDALEAIRIVMECEEELLNAIANKPQSTNSADISAPEAATPGGFSYKNNYNAIFNSPKENVPAPTEVTPNNNYSPK